MYDHTRRFLKELNDHSDDPIDDPYPAAPRVKKQYPQDWPAYDAAKTNEDVLFKQLLSELLLLAVKVETGKRTGRKGFDTRTKIFCMCIKAYYKSDLRKTTSILRELQHVNIIGKAPSYKSIDNFLNDHALNKLLDQLILITALPLACVERTAAMDSTGMSVRKYDSWQQAKWGTQTERTRCFRKLHAVVGCKTNIFISAEVTLKTVSDVTMLPTVVSDKPQHFDMEDFVADKAYSSRAVYEFLHDLGLTTFIPFKKTSSSTPKGSKTWKEMFEFFRDCPEEYLERYHQRSNVETCFHMLKQRFGHQLMTRNFVANQNEIKVRVLCHNLTVLIQEAAELGIVPRFDECVKMIHPVKKHA
jgi:transposase